ncbi:SVEP1 [Branchiostoma lanceolatum]|uniref:SVEP1 protein n=1 Tax=Branchiostoma lanceolatum TaxID=7740 RepID=A0A8S4MMH6_BRALA|nr:SVEP1 [Branchiostoma lanceolatum]
MQPTDGDFKYGDVFSFTCETGYQPSDPTVPETQQLQCVVDPGFTHGRWEGTRVACSKTQCEQLHAPAHGYRHCNDSNWYQSECKFDCGQGYILNGSTARNCQKDKQWTGTDASCEGVTCDRLNPLPNVVVNPRNCIMNKTSYLGSCIVSCEAGYTSTNGQTALVTTCDASSVPGSSNGTWTEPTDGFICQDTTPPVIFCPSDITADNDPGLDSAQVNWTAPVATDTTGVTPVVLGSVTPPRRFSVGRHTVNYTAMDETGLRTSCYFEIEIKDVEPPTLLSCPDDIIAFGDQSATQVYWEEPTFADNADKELQIFKTRENGTEFYWGTYIVEYRAEDDGGNSRTCEFTVDVAPHRCEYYRPPVNGAVACDTWLYGAQFCTALCNNQYEFATSPAQLYVCGASGDWSTFPPGHSLPWPDCSVRRDSNEVSKGLEAQYFVGVSHNESTQVTIKEQYLEILQGSVFGMLGACFDDEGNNACLVENVVVYSGQVNNAVGYGLTTVHNSLCYKVAGFTDQLSSEQFCSTQGGSLALIKDTATQNFVASLIHENNSVNHWIGIKPPAVTFLNTDLSAVQDQQLWAPNQPPALCVYMDSGANYKFSVGLCSEKNGFVCQSDIKTCERDVCLNGGICTSCFGDSHKMCSCLPGFSGERCETNVDECSSSPCVNGGTCVDGDNSYSCTCAQGFDGDNCENDLDLCNPNPCPFNWNCADNGGHLTCGLKADLRQSDPSLPRCSPSSCPAGMTCKDGGPGLYSCMP